jgi:homopolymeric O-antigen transport system permease protein
MHTPLVIGQNDIIRRSMPYTGTRGEMEATLEDFIRGLQMWPIWTRLAWQDVTRRYRRTLIGPYWTSLSYAILIGAMALVFSNLWHMKLSDYLPYLSSGFIAWIFITTIILDGCNVFVMSEAMLKNSILPTSVYIYAMLAKNVLVMGHHLSVYAIILLVYLDVMNWRYLLILPALAIILLNGVWLTLALGIVVARYRDVQQVVASVVQIMLFITPIFWPVKGISGTIRYFLVEPNILYHAVSLLRLPLMGQVPTLLDWGVMIAVTLGGWAVTFLVFARYRRYLAFWI